MWVAGGRGPGWGAKKALPDIRWRRVFSFFRTGTWSRGSFAMVLDRTASLGPSEGRGQKNAGYKSLQPRELDLTSTAPN